MSASESDASIAPDCSGKCSVDGCVIPYNRVRNCVRCGTVVCSAHERRCKHCMERMCPEHLKAPVCDVCTRSAACERNDVYDDAVERVTARGDNPQVCSVAGCEIPLFNTHKCAREGCTKWICDGHTRECHACNNGGYCHDHVPTAACTECTAEWESALAERYTAESTVVLRGIEVCKKIKAKIQTKKRKAAAEPEEAPASKMVRADE